ncbi:DUF533 domain-containing protein [Cypionkella sp.]|uniref:DUF533 domain-containing protein n=1 Tax=Cypionkella sp. TaxID=2811411 RepID=UPI002FDE53E5
MSLVGTLAKVALGVAVAKGVSSLTHSNTGASQGSGSGGLADMLGGLMGGGGQSANSGLGGLFDQLSAGATGQSGGVGGLLAGMTGATSGASGQGGLADMLGGLIGGQSAQAPAQSGGLADMLGGLLGAGGAAAGGLGGLLGALGGAQADAPAQNSQSFGQLLSASLANQGEPDVAPTAHQNAAAGLMLSAMIQAAKSDGAIQEDERQKLMANLGDATPEELAFVKTCLDAPVSIPNLVAHVPAGMQAQVYTMSLMAINLDSQAEAQYLNDLAAALGLTRAAVDQIHSHLGVASLYA